MVSRRALKRAVAVVCLLGVGFEEPMYLFVDTEVFVWEGLPTLEALRDPELNTMLVDWVRAWRLVEQ